MRRLLLASLLAFAVVPFAACSKKAAESSENKLPEMTVEELDKQLASGACQAVDANGDGTRKKMGIIPGAVLLSDTDTFNAAELPADKAKPLVFYCANTHCGASHEAAEKAMTAGHKNVKVLPEGIAGWVKAGKKTASI